MPAFRYAGLASQIADDVRATLRSPQYGHPAHREPARGYGPCRHCLRTFHVGQEDRLLFTYQPFAPGSLPAPGPVFIHADGCARYDALDFPPDFRGLPLVVEGYADGGRLVAQEWVGESAAEAVIEGVFRETTAAFVHLRNAEAGCFMARVERCFDCD
ncbi:MAG: DUF1203 domain-containing protein [Gemmatimonadetes bacterium]|nr:DUF1203 domain-containing protein [Gemmatimonadota bacterium]MBP9202256.1 DUF1203 domain-containing protein [Gemmatimonadales bacterium]MBK7351466.1 DUF1203 domain-containing protein [Gemmatimonadota bacterium]MBK7716022.1 DUF1203 domain-containing protein [Gemmatimonadota bacterium]MBK7786629.1 DUF1203 domain-containing protein [Gemmatimonadota bacterium]